MYIYIYTYTLQYPAPVHHDGQLARAARHDYYPFQWSNYPTKRKRGVVEKSQIHLKMRAGPCFRYT